MNEWQDHKKEWQDYKKENMKVVETLNADIKTIKKKLSTFKDSVTELQRQSKIPRPSLAGINSTFSNDTNKLEIVTDAIVRVNAFETMISDYFQDQVHQFIVLLSATDSNNLSMNVEINLLPLVAPYIPS